MTERIDQGGRPLRPATRRWPLAVASAMLLHPAALVGGGLPLGVAGVVLGVAAGCGAPAPADEYLNAMASGRRAYSAGRFSEAEQAYLLAERLATRVKDRDEAIFLQARMRELRGDWAGAQERYRHLVAVSPTGPRTVRAIFELAETEIARGDEERGWAALEAALLRHPNHGSARRALSRLVRRIGEQQGEDAARAFLLRAEPAFRGTEAEIQSQYELAQSWERSGNLARARDQYVAVAERYPYPYGNLTDDSYWRAAMMEERLGRYHEAIALLRRMVSPKESDITGSSFERPRFPVAQLRIAKIFQERLGDNDNARRELHRIYENHPEWNGVDDALWKEALLARQAGDADDACAVMRLIGDEYPHSRYLRCADRMCPELAAVDPEQRGCPYYIARTLTGEPDLAADEWEGGGGAPPEEDTDGEQPLGAAVSSE